MRKLLVYLITGSLVVGSHSLYGQGLGVYHPKPSILKQRAQVEGDVSVVTQSGDVKKLAYGKVSLFHTDSVAGLMRNACALIDSLQSKSVVDVAALTSAEASISSQLKAATLVNSTTGKAAHYKFVISRPGRYTLFAETKVGEHRYQVIKALTLQGGEIEKVDLDSTSMTKKPYCPRP